MIANTGNNKKPYELTEEIMLNHKVILTTKNISIKNIIHNCQKFM